MRIGAVSYLNTKPLLYGIRGHRIMNRIELTEDYPARVAQLLMEDRIDIGLVPIAAVRQMKEWHIVSDFCIATDGEVASVCLFSQVPMEEVKRVYLDYQSRTSVLLARILLKEYWKKDVELLPATGEDFRDQVGGNTAAVVIGDRALEQRSHSAHIYDLGTAWKEHTGLPFVFAAWISNKPIPADFIEAFNEANAEGVARIADVVADHPYPHFDLQKYYTDNVHYRLDDRKRQAIDLFLRKADNI
ncbi:MAG TPA: menaquinone biosynthesis protein [Flavisolibacter sp.]